MSNNRLHIRDRRTGETFFLAKSNAPAGWRLACTAAEFEEWLRGRDLEAVDGGLTTLQLVDESEGDHG